LLGTNEPTANGWAPDHRYRIKVLDFGLSKAVRGDRITFNSPLTSDGHMVGTPGYFAPELLLWDPAGQERPIGPLVDLYAVGLLGYEMLMAEPAFHGVGAAAIFQQLTQQPKPPPTWVRRLTIFPVIEHLMQRDPQQRCPTARAALAALQPPAEIEDAPLLR
jgi:serine/threonine-protein kinase